MEPVELSDYLRDFVKNVVHDGVHTLTGKLSRNLARIFLGLNLSCMVVTFYLSDLLIGVGCVTGVTFKTNLSNTNFIDLLTLW